MGVRLFFFAALLLVTSCANDAPPPQTSGAAKAARGQAQCPAVVDRAFGAALVARHAKAYGSYVDVKAALPLSLLETEKVEGRVGTRETALSNSSSRTLLVLGSSQIAFGVSPRGPWMMRGTGIVEPLAREESNDPSAESWFLRRDFTRPAALDSAKFACKPLPAGGARVDVSFDREEPSTPVYAFDLDTAALLAVAHKRADGRILATTFESWSEPDHGVRWPKKRTAHTSKEESATFELTDVKRGLECSHVDASSNAVVPDGGEACTLPPPDRVQVRWPAPDAQGRTLVRVPFTSLGGVIIVHALVNGRDVKAFMSTATDLTEIDASSPTGHGFTPVLDNVTPGQRGHPGNGELQRIELGDLVEEHVAAASLPLRFADFGLQPPEVLLGSAFFADRVTRVDYIHHELTFEKIKDGSRAPSRPGRMIRFTLRDGRIVVDASLEGVEAPLVIDAGSGRGIDLVQPWSSTHGIPARRQRLGKASLGPVSFDGVLTNVEPSADNGAVAGFVGDGMLARCDAVTIDMGMRLLWLEGACDRHVPEPRAGWQLERKSAASCPYTVKGFWPNSGAEAAGMKVGDCIVDVGGKPVSGDVATWRPLEEQPAGTKLPVTISRAGASMKLVIELRDLGR